MPTLDEILARAAARSAPAGQPPTSAPTTDPNDPIARAMARATAAGAESSPGSTLDTFISGGLRFVPSVAGGLIGAAAAAPTGPGAILGLSAGGAAGAGLGDFLAQQYEIARGIRTEYSPWGTAVETGLGAIPIKGASRLLPAMTKAGAMSGLAQGAHDFFEHGRMPELEDLLFSTGVGMATGGVVHGVGRGYNAVRARGQAAEQQAADAMAAKVNKAAGASPVLQDASQVPADVVTRAVQRADPTVTPGVVGRGGRFKQQHQPVLSPPMARTLSQAELLPEARTTDAATQANAERAMHIRALMRQRMAGQGVQQQSLTDLVRQRDDAARRVQELSRLHGVDQSVPEPPSVPYEAGPGERAIVQESLPGSTPQRRGEPTQVPMRRVYTERDEIAELQRQLDAMRRIAEDAGVMPDLPTVAPYAARSADPDIRAVADDAVANGFPGTLAQAEAMAEQRARALYEAMLPETSGPGANGLALLREIARRGGIALQDVDTPGEARWLAEFRDQTSTGKGSNVLAGVPNVFRRTRRDYDFGQRVTGKTAEDMAELLRNEGYPFQSGDELIQAIAQAKRDFEAGAFADEAFDFPRYARGAGVLPGDQWWATGGSGRRPAARPTEDDVPDWVTDDDGGFFPGEPGEHGGVSPRLATSLAGAAAGGIGGAAAPAEDNETRLRNAAVGVVLGGLGGGAAAGALTRRRPLPPGVSAPQPINPQDAGPRTYRTASGANIRGGVADKGVGRRVLQPMGDFNLMPGEGEIRGKDIHRFNLDKYPTAVRGALMDVITRNGGAVTNRRGVRSNALTNEASQRLVVELDKELKPGSTLNAEEFTAYRNALVNVTDRKMQIAARIAEAKANGVQNTDDLMDLWRAQADEDVLFKSLRGATAEAGRALQIHKQMAKLLPSEARILLQGKGGAEMRAALENMAELLSKVKDPVEAMKIARDHQAWKPLERATSYFMGNILSGIQTHERNILGTAMNVATGTLVKGTVGAPLDALQSALSGKPREVYAGEMLHDIIGAASSMDKALADAVFTLKHGFSEESLNEMLSDMTQLRIARKEWAGGGRNPFNAPHRMLEAADRFFVTLNRGMLTHSRAYSLARQAADKAGIRPGSKQFADFMSKQMAQERITMSPKIQQEILDEARKGVFRGEPGKIANWVNSGKKISPAMNFVVPFVSTPANVLRAGYEHTPVSLAVKGARRLAGNKEAFGTTSREQTMTAARGAFGLLATAPLAYLAATGRLSGAGSNDQSTRDQQFESGWRPHSVKLPLPNEAAALLGAERSPDGEYWVSYNLIQPLAFQASLVANAFEAYEDQLRKGTKATREQDLTEMTAAIGQRVAKSALSQSYFTGLFGLMEAVNDKEGSAMRWAKDLARGFVPMSGFQRNLQRAVDPVVRSPRGMKESLMADIPGLSQQVPAQIGRWGQESQRSGNIARRSFMVPEIEPATMDPIDQELARLGVAVGRPSDTLNLRTGALGTSRQLTRDEATQLQVARGSSVRAALEQIINAPSYANLPESVQRLLVERAIDGARTRTGNVAKLAFQTGRPDLLAALIDQARGGNQR